MKKLTKSIGNVGGVTSAYAIPVSDFNKVTYNPTSGKISLTLKSLDNVIEIECYKGELFTEVLDETDEGLLYHPLFSGKIFSVNREKTIILSTLAGGEWLLLHHDKNGQMKLSGTVDVPLSFTYSDSTGDDGSCDGGISYQFSAHEPQASVHVDYSPF